MSDQTKLFHGYEIQAEYLDIPGISGKLGIREFLPAEIEQPEVDDIIELTIRFKLGIGNQIKHGNDGNRRGEVADVWIATPLTDTIRFSAYMTREEDDANWREKHGAVGE